VDDDASNLLVLEDILQQQGHAVRTFPLGKLAIAAAIEKPPDLILLDVNMPEMNGYQVCEALRAKKELVDIPVIFLSVLSQIEDQVKGFLSGAFDYISKPFEFEEVRVRVDVQLKLHNLNKALKVQNENLEQIVAARTRALAAAYERLTILDNAKNDFLKLISHEFRTPLNGILGVGDLLLEQTPSTERNDGLRGLFNRGRQRILSILDDSLLLGQIEANAERFKSLPVSLHAVLSRGIEKATEFAEFRNVTIMPPPAMPDLVLGNEELLVRAVHALLETAVKFSEKGHAILVSHSTLPHSVDVVMESDGTTIPESSLAKFFEIFSIGEALTPGGDLGLGPPVASRVLALFGASCSVANREPNGIRLTISLKVPESNP
jgi:DNA-binding response OmpR family regulator